MKVLRERKVVRKGGGSSNVCTSTLAPPGSIIRLSLFFRHHLWGFWIGCWGILRIDPDSLRSGDELIRGKKIKNPFFGITPSYFLAFYQLIRGIHASLPCYRIFNSLLPVLREDSSCFAEKANVFQNADYPLKKEAILSMDSYTLYHPHYLISTKGLTG